MPVEIQARKGPEQELQSTVQNSVVPGVAFYKNLAPPSTISGVTSGVQPSRESGCAEAHNQ